MVRNRAVTAVKCRIEAGDLGQLWKPCADGADRREIVGLVERRKGDVAFELGKHDVVDEHRPVVVRATVDDAMADRGGFEVLGLTQPAGRRLHRGRNVRNLFRFE